MGPLLTLALLNPDILAFVNSVDPDQFSEEENWSGFALFAIQIVKIYLQPGSSNLTGWQVEVGVTSYLFNMARVKIHLRMEAKTSQCVHWRCILSF